MRSLLPPHAGNAEIREWRFWGYLRSTNTLRTMPLMRDAIAQLLADDREAAAVAADGSRASSAGLPTYSLPLADDVRELLRQWPTPPSLKGLC
jgi:hypothetical protein